MWAEIALKNTLIALVVLFLLVVIVRLLVLFAKGAFGLEKYTTTTSLGERVGSDTQDIHGVHGTVEQKKRFPKYTDIAQYGVTSIPFWDDPDYVPPAPPIRYESATGPVRANPYCTN